MSNSQRIVKMSLFTLIIVKIFFDVKVGLYEKEDSIICKESAVMFIMTILGNSPVNYLV